MYQKNNQWVYSPTDLVTFMRSPFELWMNRAVKLKPELELLRDAEDEALKALQQKGYQHEGEVFVALTDSASSKVIDIDTFPVHERHAETIQAMQQGFDVIYQASLSLEPFAGKADFLIKVDTPSKLGDYSYEV